MQKCFQFAGKCHIVVDFPQHKKDHQGENYSQKSQRRGIFLHHADQKQHQKHRNGHHADQHDQAQQNFHKIHFPTISFILKYNSGPKACQYPFV